MGFFDDLPAPEPAPSSRHHPWEPPEAEFPGIVAIDTLLLGRTDEVAVAVTGLSAFSAGIEIFVTARIRPSARHAEEHLRGGPRDLAASRRSFRFGLQFSDGGKVAGSPRRRQARPRFRASRPGSVPDRRRRQAVLFRLPVVDMAVAARRAAGVRLRVAGVRHCRIPGRHRCAAHPRRGTAQRAAMAGNRRLTARPVPLTSTGLRLALDAAAPQQHDRPVLIPAAEPQLTLQRLSQPGWMASRRKV